MSAPKNRNPPASAVGDASKAWAGVAAIFAATIIAYWPVLGAGFIWDDDGHVTSPALRSLHGLWRIWFELGATQQYYPVLHSAFWLEHRLWGDSPLGYHLLNVLLHATAACLFALVLRRALTLPREAAGSQAPIAASGMGELAAGRMAWLAAALFALHPVAVESVAWVSEQKNTLSTGFYLLSALAYLRFDRERRRRLYWCALGLFILALLTKTVTATLPAALLVVVWWRRGRLSWRSDVRPLLAWLLIGLGVGLASAWVERDYIGAHGADFAFSPADRVLIAGRAALFYLGKLVWPHPLVFIYPRWSIDAHAFGQWIFPLAALGLLGWLFVRRRRARGPLAAGLFFLGTLFPALGFVNVYPFVFSFVADHFQYVASLGFFSLLAAGLALLPERMTGPARFAGGVSAGLLLTVWGGLTWRQSLLYRDAATLYRATLDDNPGCWLAHDNLGILLARRGDLRGAIAHYEQAARLNPRYAEVFNNLGNARAQLQQWPEAFAAYAAAVQLRPAFVAAQLDWGNALNDSGASADAVAHYEIALRLQPGLPEALYRLGNALANSGRLADAIGRYAEALRARPDFAEAEANLGLALATAHRAPEALPHLEHAVQLAPRYAEAHAYFGFALAQSGRLLDAVTQYRAALALHPDDPDVHYQLGAAWRALGRLSEASEEFAAARRLAAPRGR